MRSCTALVVAMKMAALCVCYGKTTIALVSIISFHMRKTDHNGYNDYGYNGINGHAIPNSKENKDG